MKKILLILMVFTICFYSITQAENSISESGLIEASIVDIRYKEKKPEYPTIEISVTPRNEDIINEINPVRNVTVNFIDINGNAITKPEEFKLRSGDKINMSTPNVQSFVAVTSGDYIVPDHDIELTIIYLPAEFFSDNTGEQIWMIENRNKIVNIISINDYENPLGIGSIVMNVGVSCE